MSGMFGNFSVGSSMCEDKSQGSVFAEALSGSLLQPHTVGPDWDRTYNPELVGGQAGAKVQFRLD